MKQLRKRLTYANVMSSLAVFLVLGGATAIAAGQLGKNSVGSKQLKRNAVTTKKIKNNAITGAKIKNGAITGAKVNAASLGTVPNATHAVSADTAVSAGKADNAGNAGTVGGQSVVKIFKTLTEGQSDVQIAGLAGFNFVASCQSNDADLEVEGPTGPGFVMEAGGVPASLSGEVTQEYESSKPGEGGNILVDKYSDAAGEAGYGISSFYAATASGTVISGTLGYDFDTFNSTPENTCVFTGHLIVG